jgi:hypothetical protein
MTTTDWLVIAGAVVLIAAVNWWFFIAGNSGATHAPKATQAPDVKPVPPRDGAGGAS